MSQKLIPILKDGIRVDGYFTDSKTEIIYYKKSIEGKKIKFSTGQTKLLQAKKIANKKIKDFLGVSAKKRVSLIGDELKHWIDLRRSEAESGEIKYGTLTVILNSEKKIRPFWENKYPEEINRTTVIEWCDWFYETYPDQQMENSVKYFKNFCKFLNEKIVKNRPLLPSIPTIKDPRAQTHRVSRKKKKERILTDNEIAKILSVCDLREKLIISLMYYMAFRVESDALSAEKSQFFLNESPPIYVFNEGNNKGKRTGKQGIHDQVLELLNLWLPNTGNSIYIFPQKNDLKKHLKGQQINWDKIKRESGVTWGWTAHTFRHTCLTKLFSDPTNPMAIICKCFRISLKEAMKTYIHTTDENIEKMRNAIQGISNGGEKGTTNV